MCSRPFVWILLLAATVTAQPAERPSVLDVKWTPMPIRSEKQLQLGMSGGEGGQCLHGIARAASDDKRIYLAVDVVGVWKSIDGGVSWQPCRNLGLHCLGTTSVAVNPKNADRVLVYSQAVWEKPREPEEGVYQSLDGGDTWQRVLEVANVDKRRSYRHLVDFSADGRRVYCMAYKGGIYRSDDGGDNWNGPLSLKDKEATEIRCDPRQSDVIYVAAEDGLYLSDNAGLETRRVESLGDAKTTTISIDPATPNRFYAIKEGEGLFRSDDGCKTFAHIRSGDDELDGSAMRLFQSPVDPRRLILSSDKKMRISHDAGKMWRAPRIDFSRSFVQQGVWSLAEGFAWSNRDPNRVVGAISCGMYGSSDGGLNWTDSMSGYLGFHHGWSDGAVSFALDDPNRFAFFCYDYALNITADGGRSFRNGRLKEKVRDWWGMYVGDMSPTWKKQPLVIVAAGNYWKNQLVRSEDGGKSWSAIPDTDGAYFFVRFHPRDSHIVYADDRRSDDEGKSFKKLEHSIYAFAPSKPDTVYGMGDGKLWRSDDRGDHWKALPDPPRPAREEIGRRDIEVDPKNPDVVWAMTPPDCSVFDGHDWRLVPASQWVTQRAHPFVSRMAIDPQRPERIVVGLDAQGAGYLFLSDDRGLTWSDITGNLPRLGSNQSLNIQPQTGRIFIGAGFGTWTAMIPIKG